MELPATKLFEGGSRLRLKLCRRKILSSRHLACGFTNPHKLRCSTPEHKVINYLVPLRQKNKSPKGFILFCAEGGSRTLKPLRTIDFESIASAIPPPQLSSQLILSWLSTLSKSPYLEVSEVAFS